MADDAGDPAHYHAGNDYPDEHHPVEPIAVAQRRLIKTERGDRPEDVVDGDREGVTAIFAHRHRSGEQQVAERKGDATHSETHGRAQA